MASKKAKRVQKVKKYFIEVRVDVSYVTEEEVYARSILEAGKAAMNTARADALSSLPDGATLDNVYVMIEDGWLAEEDSRCRI